MMVVFYRKLFYIISAVVIGLSLLSVAMFGLKLGIDFTGGTLVEVTYTDTRPEKAALEERLNTLALGGYSLRETGSDGFILRSRTLNEEERIAVRELLAPEAGAFKTESFSSVGPSIGEELGQKALIAITLVILGIVLFVAFAFRHVAEPVASWKYGVVTIVTLLHDVVVPVGVFAALGHYAGAEIDTLFVTALLVILGFSVHDTIVVFDRIRENLRINTQGHHTLTFEEVVAKSVKQTYARSINTSLTTALTLLALYLFGATTTEMFALTMLIGIVVGTYSSICIASPLLVSWEKWSRKKA